MVSIKVDVEKCTGCGTCVNTCPVTVYQLQKVEGKPSRSLLLRTSASCVEPVKRSAQRKPSRSSNKLVFFKPHKEVRLLWKRMRSSKEYGKRNSRK